MTSWKWAIGVLFDDENPLARLFIVTTCQKDNFTKYFILALWISLNIPQWSFNTCYQGILDLYETRLKINFMRNTGHGRSCGFRVKFETNYLSRSHLTNILWVKLLWFLPYFHGSLPRNKYLCKLVTEKNQSGQGTPLKSRVLKPLGYLIPNFSLMKANLVSWFMTGKSFH